MEVRPGYKHTEVGVVPEEWGAVPLHSLVKRHNSGVYKKSELYGRGCNIIGVSDIYAIDSIDGQRFSEVPLTSAEQAKHTLQANDLLYGESSLVREGIARTVHVTERGAGTAFAWHTRRYAVDQKALLSNYAYYFLQSRLARKHMMDQAIQTAITGINTVAYFACPVLVPPLPEQRTIAAALSNVDALLGGLDRLIAKKRDLKKAAMQQLLTGQTRLPGFHGEWETLPARDIGVFKGGSGFPLSAQGETGGEYPFFKVSDMNNEGNDTFMTTANHYISEQTRRRLGATAFPADSIVFAKVGAAVFLERKKILGQASCIDNNMAAFVLDKSRADVGYVHALLLSMRLGALVATTALPALNGKQLGEMLLAVPPLPEQIAIAATLSDMDAELSALEARREKTRALKQGMMQELLTGRTRLV